MLYALNAPRLNEKAVQMILETNGVLIKWLRSPPYYYKIETQIFVQAGVDEEAGEWWETGTPNYTFVGKPFEIMNKNVPHRHCGGYL